MIFPRKLDRMEKELLDFILPKNRSGYAAINEKITNLFVIGNGRFGENNYIIGEKTDVVDLTAPSSPVIAAGYKTIDGKTYYVLVHEEFEKTFEIDYQIVGKKESDFTYSDWLPGKKAPGDNSELREIIIIPDEAVLVIAPKHKRIWVYIKKTGINHFIPMANLYNEIMRVKGEKDPKIALNVKRIFSNHRDLSDEEIRRGFYSYNRYLKKVDLDFAYSNKAKQKVKRSFFSKLRGM